MTVHIVGAGLAGLSCALALVDAGHEVALHEGARQAGGRSRSWHEPSLDRIIDNGTHMVVGANHAVFTYLDRIGSRDSLVPGPAAFPMLSLKTGKLWTASPFRLAPSVLASMWRMPAERDQPIIQSLGHSRNFHRFWDPLCLAVMNTPAKDASSKVFRTVLQRTLWRGQKASQPFLARDGLSESFIQPALAALEKAYCPAQLNHPLRAIGREGHRATSLQFDDGIITLGPKDKLVLATPWIVARGLLPELPDMPASPIINAHFRLNRPVAPPKGGFLGLLDGAAQWLFLRDDVVSVTVSGAGPLIDRDGDELGQLLWRDAARALNIDFEPATTRVIKEKRATLYHTPAIEAIRPAAQFGENLILAGDWTATGLPCTLEGALTSGGIAAVLALRL